MADTTPVDIAPEGTAAAPTRANANRSTTPTSDAFREFIFSGFHAGGVV